MKKIGVVLSLLVALSASAFALNAEAGAGDCVDRKVAFEKKVAALRNDSFIVQNILINMADPMQSQSDAQAKEDAVCYATFRVNGMDLVDFVRANADIFRQVNPLSGLATQTYDDLQTELLHFADRVEKLAKQEALDKIASQDNEDWVVQHVLGNLADPMVKLSDEEAAPHARVYKQLKVGQQPLLQFVTQQAHRFESYAVHVANDLTDFANRVNMLAK